MKREDQFCWTSHEQVDGLKLFRVLQQLFPLVIYVLLLSKVNNEFIFLFYLDLLEKCIHSAFNFVK